MAKQQATQTSTAIGYYRLIVVLTVITSLTSLAQNFDVYTMNVNGTDQTNLTRHPANDGIPTNADQLSLIFFSSKRGNNTDIYSMFFNGTSQQNLTNHQANDSHPKWVGSLARILFTSDRGGNQDVFLMNANGTSQLNLSNHPANDYSASWISSAEKIIFVSDRNGQTDLYLMNPSGTDQQNITNSPSIETEPHWMTGNRILFSTNRDGNYEIYSCNLNGSDLINLTNHPAEDRHPVWVPTLNRILFCSWRNGNQEIYSMLPNGQSQTNLTNHPSDDTEPAWIEGLNRIAFSSNRKVPQVGTGIYSLKAKVSETQLPAEGQAKTVVTIELKSSKNQLPVTSETIFLKTDNGQVSSKARHQGYGIYTATYTAGTKLGRATIDIRTSNDETTSVFVTLFLGPPRKIQLVLSPNKLYANSQEKSKIRIQIVDGGGNVIDRPPLVPSLTMAPTPNGILAAVSQHSQSGFVSIYSAGQVDWLQQSKVDEVSYQIVASYGDLEPASLTISLLKDQPPSGMVKLPQMVKGPNGTLYTNQTELDLSLKAKDDRTPIKQLEIRFRHTTIQQTQPWPKFESFSPDKKWTIPADDGQVTIDYQLKDHIGNITFGSLPAFYFDSTPPELVLGSIESAVVDDQVYIPTNVLGLSVKASDNLSKRYYLNGSYSIDNSNNWLRLALSSNQVETFKINLPDKSEPMKIMVRITDIAGNQAESSLNVFIDKAGPEITSLGSRTFTYQQPLDLNLEIEDVSPATARLYYQPLNSTEYQLQVESQVIGQANFVIESSQLGYGGRFYFEAEDALKRKTRLPEGTDHYHAQAVGSFTVAPEFPAQSWNLFSVPLSTNQPLSGALTQIYGQDNWQTYTYTSQGQLNLVNDNTVPTAGSSFWLITKSAKEASFFGTTVAFEPLQLELDEGWNLISNPFMVPINFGSIKVMINQQLVPISDPEAETLVRPRFWRWQDSTANDVTDGTYEVVTNLDEQLMPWRGYWVYAQKEAVVNLEASTSSVVYAASAPSINKRVKWTLVAADEQSSVTTGTASIPIQDEGQLTFLQPPSLTTNSVYLDLAGKSHQQVVLSDQRQELIWSLQLDLKQQSQLNCQTELLGSGYLYLEDLKQGRRYLMENSKQISFSVGTHNLRIRVSPQKLGLELEDHIPQLTRVLPNYPNPFNPETWIPFQLAQDGKVSLVIYDDRGQLIRQLDLGHLLAGSYISPHRAIHWNGRDTNGEKTASGIYFCQLRTNNQTFTSKMVLMK